MRQDCDEEGKVRQETRGVEVERWDKERGWRDGKRLKGLGKVKR